MKWLKDDELVPALKKIQYHDVHGWTMKRTEQRYLFLALSVDMCQGLEVQYEEIHNAIFSKIGNGKHNFSSEELSLLNKQSELGIKIEAMLRAIYEHAAIYIGILCAESQRDENTFDSSLKKLSKKNPSFIGEVDTEAVNSGWEIAEYRNKLVAHHDKKRWYGFRSGKGGCRLHPLEPMSEDANAPEPLDVANLWLKYKDVTTNPHENNYREQLSHLFSSVPVIVEDSFNPDRGKVDLLVETYGVVSLNSTEILQKARSFTLGLAEVL